VFDEIEAGKPRKKPLLIVSRGTKFSPVMQVAMRRELLDRWLRPAIRFEEFFSSFFVRRVRREEPHGFFLFFVLLNKDS
jgi:hypothetical protein